MIKYLILISMRISNHTVPIIFIIILISAFLRLYGLDRQSLWYDEIFEINYFQQFLKKGGYNAPDTPPLHPFLIHISQKLLPDTDFALRALPTTFGLISVLLMFLLGKRLFNRRTGLIASYLLAISPFHIWYSQEVRMYALQWMLALTSLIFFFRALHEPNRNNYIGYIISTILGLYTLQLTIFLLILQGIYSLLFFRYYNVKLSRWISALIIISLLYSPWIIYHFLYLTNRGASFPKEIKPLIFIPYTFFSYFAGFSIGPSLRELHLYPSFNIIIPYIHIIGPLMVTYGLVLSIGIFSLRRDTPRLIFLLLLTSIPIVGLLILIYKFVPKMSYNVRYTGIASFGFILIISKGIDFLAQREWKVNGKSISAIVLAIITGFSAYSYWNYQFNPKYHKEDVRTAASYIKENYEDADVILVITSTCALTINRYLDNGIQSTGYPPLLNTNNKEEVIRELEKMANGKKRIWLVLCREWYEKELTDWTKQWLDENYKEIETLHKDDTEIANLTISCYELRERVDEKI